MEWTRDDLKKLAIGVASSGLFNAFVYLLDVFGIVAANGSTGSPIADGVRIALVGMLFFVLVFLAISYATEQNSQRDAYAVLAFGLIVLLTTSWMYSSNEALSDTLSLGFLLVFSFAILAATFSAAWQFRHPEKNSRGLITALWKRSSDD